MSTPEDDGSGYEHDGAGYEDEGGGYEDVGAGEEGRGEPARSYASGRDMYVAEQGDLHLYLQEPDGTELHRTVGPATDDDCPYPGLVAFTADRADHYFGRARLRTELGERIADCHAARTPLVVVAPSGAGKTSLLQAGLWQDLDRGRVPVPGSRDWPRLLLTPTARPSYELTARLARLAGLPEPESEAEPPPGAAPGSVAALESVAEPPSVAAPGSVAALESVAAPGSVAEPGFGGEPGAAWARLAERLRRKTGRSGGGGRILLVVDQAEELFTLCDDPAERQAFVDLLARLADPGDGTAPLAVVVLALRADFYARCAELPWLRAAVQNGQLLLAPLSRDELLDAIRLPARAAGLRLEPGLVELLVADFGATRGLVEPGALPLLAHALRATWQNRQGRLLTAAGYTGTGGVAHALGNTAEAVHERLDPAARRTARRLFLGLVAIGEDSADSRRRIRRDQLLSGIPEQEREAAEAVLAAFTSRRLLVQERDTVCLTHEALLTAWPRLHAWINDDRPRNLVLQDLDTAARTWHAGGREAGDVYEGKRLDRALAAAPEPADPAEDDPLRRAFLDASVRRRRRAVRNRRRLAAVLAALVLIASVAAVAAVRQRDTARAEQRAALAARIVAQADRLRGADPALAAQLNLVAHRLAPRSETTLNLLADGNTIMPRTLTGFRLDVGTVVYRPDGKVLAGVDTGGTIRLWDVADRSRPRPLGRPIEDVGVVVSLSFSPDGRTLIAGRYNKGVALWNVADPGRPVPLDPPPGVGKGSGNMAFSPDGRLLVGIGPQGRILFWDFTDPARPALLPRTLTGFTGFPVRLAFGPDGRTLTATGNDFSVWVWDLARADRPPARLVPPTVTHAVYETVYSPDGRTLAMVNDNRVWLWNLTDPSRPTRHPVYLPTVGTRASALAFSPDGQTIAVADDARTVRLWDVADPADPKGRPAVPQVVEHVMGLAFAADGRTLAGGTEGGTIKLWSLPDRTLPAAAYDSEALAFTPDGRILATGGKDGTVRLWSLAEPVRPRAIGEVRTDTDAVTALAFGKDGRTLAGGGASGALGLWDVADPARPRRLGRPAARPEGPLALGPDARSAAAGDTGTAAVWDLSDPARLRRTGRSLRGDRYVEELAVGPGAGTVAVGYGDGSLALWDPAKPYPLAELAGADPKALAPQRLVFSADGRTLAKADRAVLTVWDVTDPARPVARGAATGSSMVTSLAFRPSGDLLAEGNADGTVRLADSARPTPLSRGLFGGTARVTALAFAPDGRTLASAGEDQPVRLWSTDPDAAARWICTAAGNVITPAQWAQYVPGLAYEPPCGGEGGGTGAQG
ncbi:WD40 repeat domain-containing protein [Streptomyces sp. NPDC127114]|uniref:WD40 repeat domain-containing protein n=1 Tax=Streptomyces sp. NPDC127114 TaxID=3345366 RepID=UPI003636BD46